MGFIQDGGIEPALPHMAPHLPATVEILGIPHVKQIEGTVQAILGMKGM